MHHVIDDKIQKLLSINRAQNYMYTLIPIQWNVERYENLMLDSMICSVQEWMNVIDDVAHTDTGSLVPMLSHMTKLIKVLDTKRV